MDTNAPVPSSSLPPAPSAGGVPERLASPPVVSPASKSVTVAPVVPGFDPTLVRCAVETHVHELMWKDEDLLRRITALDEERKKARTQQRVRLMTDGYRVDEAITPKLHNLGRMLTRILRLGHPLDLFVRAGYEHQAFCLPSKKGNRLVMCLHSGLIASLSSQELLFVMGHEVGHALLTHGETLGIDFDNPYFSPLEVLRIRALERAQEISCDRIGLLACQDVRVASSALFKVNCGLTDRWLSFDETAYSRHFDELSSMAEFIDLADASETHPIMPLRVKALIAFAKSELYAKAFGKSGWTLASDEMELHVDNMLEVLTPDLSELETGKEKEAFNQFLIDGALLVIAADGVVDPQEVAWLKHLTNDEWSREELTADVSRPEYRQQLEQRLNACAEVLRFKLPELKRARLFRAMCEVAQSAGGILDAEGNVLEELQQKLGIRLEIARDAFQAAQEAQDESGDEVDSQSEPPASGDASTDPMAEIFSRANLSAAALPQVAATLRELRSRNLPFPEAVRALISWTITASRPKGVLTAAQGRKLAVSAIKVCRELQEDSGSGHKSKATPADKKIQEFGLVALFQKGETVTRGESNEPYVVVAVSPSKGRVFIAPADDVLTVEQVEPHELWKDPTEGAWPPELAD